MYHQREMFSRTLGAFLHRKKWHMVFNTDSFTIMLDKCASRCMTNSLSGLLLIPAKTNILGIGKAPEVKQGTVTWSIIEDECKVDDFIHP
jgi:hypothetical protein